MDCYIIKILSSIAFASVAFVAANGQTEKLFATKAIQIIHKEGKTNNENYVWNIFPAPGVAGSHFLEIYWQFLDVAGTMPGCEKDYVEVQLTISHLSAGKFCSSNIGHYKPFSMYSIDGIARIQYHSDSADIGSGFRLWYRLRNSSFLSPVCVNKDNKLRSGIIYSAGWPLSYASHAVPCIHKITAGADRVTKLIFIDVDLNHKGAIPTCSSLDDYIEVRGTSSSSASFEASSAISGKICGTATIKVVVTRSKYIYVKFNRAFGSQSAMKRGYFSGYISYDADPKPQQGGDKKGPYFYTTICESVVLAMLLLAAIFLAISRVRARGAPVPPLINLGDPPPQGGGQGGSGGDNANGQQANDASRGEASAPGRGADHIDGIPHIAMPHDGVNEHHEKYHNDEGCGQINAGID